MNRVFTADLTDPSSAGYRSLSKEITEIVSYLFLKKFQISMFRFSLKLARVFLFFKYACRDGPLLCNGHNTALQT